MFLVAAFKVIKGWLPPAAVKKIKFLTKSNMSEYVSEDQMLEEWGGTDAWQYAWLPESSEGKKHPQWPRPQLWSAGASQPSQCDAAQSLEMDCSPQLGSDQLSSSDSRDDTKKKTVTFAMVQSPSAESVASLGSSGSVVPGGNNNNQDILLISPAQEVIFSTTSGGELSAKIQIQNISSKAVGYKIKTTSPEKYRVRPSTGSLGPTSQATIEIQVSGGQGAGLTPASLVRDKFLITAIYLEESLSLQDLKPQQLAEALKTNKPDGQYRLRCQLAPQQTSSDLSSLASSVSPPVLPLTELDSTRQMANILKKINQVSLKQEELAAQIKLCFHILLVLVGLAVILLFVLLFFSTNDTDGGHR